MSPEGSGGRAGSGGEGASASGGAQVAGSRGDAAAGGSSATGSDVDGGIAGSSGAVGGTAGTGQTITDLFNGADLTGWTAYRETAATSPGTVLTPAEALRIFKPEDGTLRVYGDAADQSRQARHTLVSAASYSKYNFWVEYKWGTKKFAPYTDLNMYPRDAGVLFHLHNDKTQVWPSSIEFQIKDGSTGDIFALYAQCTSLARSGGTTFVDAADGGTSKLVNGSTGFVQHSRSANYEVAGWNSVQLQVDGGRAVYIVNGHIVNRVLSVLSKAGAPVTSGPVALQAEHAEVFYRNVRIQVVP